MCFPYPAPGAADVFAELKRGSVVVLIKGAGRPPVEAASVPEVILAVDGFSALTNSGRLLACTDAGLIDITGEYLADGEYKISPEAAEILRQAEIRQAESDADWQDDWFYPQDDSFV